MKKFTPAPLQNLKEKWKFFKNIDKTEFDLNNWIEWGEHFLYLVCTLFKVFKVHSLNVPDFQVHYSNIERSLSNNLFQILEELPRLPSKKSKVKKIQNLYWSNQTEFYLKNWIDWGYYFLYLVCTLFKVLKVHSLNVPDFQVHYSNIERSLPMLW